MLWGVKIIRLLILVTRSHFLSSWPIQAIVIRVIDIHFLKKDQELPPFKNVSTIDHGLTPSSLQW